MAGPGPAGEGGVHRGAEPLHHPQREGSRAGGRHPHAARVGARGQEAQIVSVCGKMNLDEFIEAQRLAHPLYWDWWENQCELGQTDLSRVPFMSQELLGALVVVANVSRAQVLYNMFVETALQNQFQEFSDAQGFTLWMVQVSHQQCSYDRAFLVCYGLWHRFNVGLQPAVYEPSLPPSPAHVDNVDMEED